MVVTMRGWADVGLWVAVCFLEKISLHRPTCKTTFTPLTQSRAISQWFRVSITFRSMRDATFFHFRNFFYTKLPFPLPWWSEDLLVENGAFVNTSWDRSTRHCAHSKRNALGGKGFGGNIFVAHGRKIFAISLTSSFPVRFFSEPWKIRRPLQLSLTSTLTLHSWIGQVPLDQRRSPLCLYHSLHYHLRPFLTINGRPGRKGGVSI